MDQLLVTKLNTPALRPGLIPRCRLTEHLNRGLAQGARLSMISAPAGYGKTTVACEWLSGQAAVSWLALEDADNDPVRFFAYLVAALRKFDPGLGQATLDYMTAPQLPAAPTLVTPLINDIALGSEQAVLVLDDLQAIRNLAIHEALDFLLLHAPPNLHVVILTREDPPLSIATLRARGQISELRTHDLRFSEEEAQEFFTATMGLALEPSVVKGLGVRTEGWVAGLQLAALSVQGCPAEDLSEFLAAFSGTDRYIMDYLVEQVLRRLPAELRSFMCAMSILDRMCAPLCDAVLGWEEDAGIGSGSRAMLQQLEAANLFLVRLDVQGQWFRFHHLFAELLRLELDPAQQIVLRRRAARWFDGKGLLPEAIEHALAGEDYAHAVQLVRRVATSLLQTSGLRTLLKWLERLPPDALLQDAELAVHKAAALFFTGQARAAFACLDELETQADARPLAAHIRGRLLAMRAWQFDLAYDMQGVRSVAAEARALLAGDDEPFYRMVALLPHGHALTAAGETRQAEQTFRETVEMGRQAGHILVTVAGLVDLSFNLFIQGRAREALELCEATLQRHVDRRGAPLPVAQMLYLPLATCLYHADRLEEAFERATLGLEASRQMLTQEIMGGDGELCLALCEFASGQVAAAHHRLQEAERRTQNLGYRRVARGLANLEAELCLREGDLVRARRWAQALPDPLGGPLVPAREVEYRVYVRYLVAEGRLEEAQRLLRAMSELARGSARHSRLIVALLWQAIVAYELHDRASALADLREAVDLAAPGEYRRLFLDAGHPALPELLAEVRAASPPLAAPAFVDALLEALGPAGAAAEGRDSASPNELLPEPLTPRELEVLQLLAEGRTYRQIAAELIVAMGTVQAHCSNIYGKLGAGNRTEALARARELRLL